MDELGFGKQVNNKKKDHVPKLKHDDTPSVNHMVELGIWFFFTHKIKLCSRAQTC